MRASDQSRLRPAILATLFVSLALICAVAASSNRRQLTKQVNTLDRPTLIEPGEGETYPDPNSPLQPCPRISPDFFRCVLYDISDKSGKEIARRNLTGCREYSGFKTEKTKTGTANCTVLPGIECAGPQWFLLENVPCVKYSEKRYPTAILLSVFLGWLGADRIYLDYAVAGSFKLLTLGGIGIWWVIDTALLLTNNYDPYKGHTWDPHP